MQSVFKVPSEKFSDEYIDYLYSTSYEAEQEKIFTHQIEEKLTEEKLERKLGISL